MREPVTSTLSSEVVVPVVAVLADVVSCAIASDGSKATAMAVAMMLRLREPLMSPPRCMSFSARLMPSGRWWSMVLGRHRRR